MMVGAGLVLVLVAVLGWVRVLRSTGLARSVFRRVVEAIAVHVVVSTLLSVALVSVGVFRVAAAQALATAVPLALLLRVRRAPWPGPHGAPWITRLELVTVLILVLVAPIALPRMELLYMENDAGVYSHRAIHHLFEGSLVADVPARAQLEGRLLEAFDQDNFLSPPRDGAGHYLGGTYSLPGNSNQFVFQFYPGWPMLMAQWAGLFGLPRMFDVVLFVALLAVLFFAFVLESRGVGTVAYAATVALFASSPLLLYFSRYTTSEAFLLFLFLFVLHFFVQGERSGTALALLGLLAITVSHVSTFLYAPLLFPVALHGHLTANRRTAAFATGAFGLLLAGIPLGLLFSRPYVELILRRSFGVLPVGDPVLLGLGALVAAYSFGLAFSMAAWRRARRGAVPGNPADLQGGRGPRLWRIAMWTVLIAVAGWTVYRSYQLGWTDHFVPNRDLGGAWGARSAYAGTGWGALAHANVVSMLMATSLVGLPLVLVLALRRGDWLCASRYRAFLLAAVLLCLGIYTFIRFDTPFNYYASRYFIPVLVPSVMLLFGELVERAPVRRGVLVALVLVGLGFNLRYAIPLYRYPAYTEEMRAVEDVAARVGEGRALFLRNPRRDDREAQRLLALLLAHAHRIPVINVVSRSDAPVDDQIREYAARLEIRDAAVLSRRPPEDGRAFEAVYFARHRLRRDIWYPHAPAKPLRRRWYLYNVAFW